MDRATGLKKWTYRDALEFYGIKYWGHDFFTVSENGEVNVKLSNGKKTKYVSLYEIAMGANERGLLMPILVRFPELLKYRIESLNRTFQENIRKYNYRGKYRGVFPIKVNQQEQVIDEISYYGKPFHHGLEAGSKAELLIALAYTSNTDSPIICNGYKDTEFIDLALYGRKLGLNVFIVVERPGELDSIIHRAREMKIDPQIGFRVKLSSTIKGKWAESAGDHSVFGLTASQIVMLLDLLKKEKMLSCLKLLHYHLGSQVSDIQNIRTALAEAARYYVALHRDGAPMGYLDIGGGLAVDYDGSKTNFVNSKNYTMNEYCEDVVDVIKNILDESRVPHAHIISESGRATVAYYSVLLFNILDVNKLETQKNWDDVTKDLNAESNELLLNLKNVYQSVNLKNLQEMFHDAIYYRDEIRSLFGVGRVGLRERGLADQLFWKIVVKIKKLSGTLRYIPEELQELDNVLADIYYGNFSLFQSLPDSWAIDQLFPIMPIHRLNEKPAIPAIIADTTCDCDGKIDKFIDLYNVKTFLLLHEFNPEEPYIIGVFLVGAYQETLGDLHNLFGDTNIISISLEGDGSIQYDKELYGDSVSDVISYLEYNPKDLLEKIRLNAERAVRRKRISATERRRIMKTFEEGLAGYTYFEF